MVGGLISWEKNEIQAWNFLVGGIGIEGCASDEMVRFALIPEGSIAFQNDQFWCFSSQENLPDFSHLSHEDLQGGIKGAGLKCCGGVSRVPKFNFLDL